MSLMIRQCMLMMLCSIFLCFLTGNVLFLAWNRISKQLESHGFVQMTYILLKFVMISYLCPVAVLIILQFFWDGIVFSLTPFISVFVCIVGIIWSIGFIVQMARYFIRNQQFQKSILFYKVEDEEILDLFEKCKRETGVRKRVHLVKALVPVPYVRGVLAPTVVLPKKNIGKDDLKIIFYHELMHIKHHDLSWKVFGNLLRWVHWYFPIMKRLFYKYDDWSETYCDFSVYTLIESRKKYFHVLHQMAIQDAGVESSVCSAVYENENGLTRRIERAKKIGKMNRMKVLTASSLVFAFCLVGSVTVAASTVGFHRGYLKVIDETETEILETNDEEFSVRIENEKQEKVDGNYKVIDYPIWKVLKENIYLLKPKFVKPNTEVRTKNIYLKKGEVLQISSLVAQEDDIKVENEKVYSGLIKDDQMRIYIECSDSLIHDFEIRESGYYRVFFLNKSDVELQFAGDFRRKRGKLNEKD